MAFITDVTMIGSLLSWINLNETIEKEKYKNLYFHLKQGAIYLDLYIFNFFDLFYSKTCPYALFFLFFLSLIAISNWICHSESQIIQDCQNKIGKFTLNSLHIKKKCKMNVYLMFLIFDYLYIISCLRIFKQRF